MRRRAIAPIVHKLERTLDTIGECSLIQEFFGKEHFGRTPKNYLHDQDTRMDIRKCRVEVELLYGQIG